MCMLCVVAHMNSGMCCSMGIFGCVFMQCHCREKSWNQRNPFFSTSSICSLHTACQKLIIVLLHKYTVVLGQMKTPTLRVLLIVLI
jgi:hypothetical protein